MMQKHEEWGGEMPPGLAPRVAVTIVVGIGWLIFLILFLAFYAGGFNIWQNVAIMFVSVLVVGAILGPMWAYWGMKTGRAAVQKRRTRKRRVRK